MSQVTVRIIRYRIISNWIQFLKTSALILLSRRIIRLIIKDWFSHAYVLKRPTNNSQGRRAISHLWRRRRVCRSSTSTVIQYSQCHELKKINRRNNRNWNKSKRCQKKVAISKRKSKEWIMEMGRMPTSAKPWIIYKSVVRDRMEEEDCRVVSRWMELDSSSSTAP